jgi:peptidoglycan/LPS O-acetylase OafA/YrhL
MGLSNTASSVALAAVLWAVLRRPGGALGRALNHPVAVGLGVLSYSLYLWHTAFIAREPAWYAAFPLNLVFILAAAGLSYTLIERPFLSLKAGLGARRTPPPSGCRVGRGQGSRSATATAACGAASGAAVSPGSRIARVA